MRCLPCSERPASGIASLPPIIFATVSARPRVVERCSKFWATANTTSRRQSMVHAYWGSKTIPNIAPKWTNGSEILGLVKFANGPYWVFTVSIFGSMGSEPEADQDLCLKFQNLKALLGHAWPDLIHKRPSMPAFLWVGLSYYVPVSSWSCANSQT